MCMTPTFALNDSALCPITVRVRTQVPTGTQITNLVTTSSDTQDPNPGNSQSTSTTTAWMPIPLLSPLGLAAAVLLLLGVSATMLYRRRSSE